MRYMLEKCFENAGREVRDRTVGRWTGMAVAGWRGSVAAPTAAGADEAVHP